MNFFIINFCPKRVPHDDAVIRRIAAFAVPAPKREDPQPLFSMTLPYDLNILDVVLLSVIALFTLRGALRGFLDEVAGLVGICTAD